MTILSTERNFQQYTLDSESADVLTVFQVGTSLTRIPVWDERWDNDFHRCSHVSGQKNGDIELMTDPHVRCDEEELDGGEQREKTSGPICC